MRVREERSISSIPGSPPGDPTLKALTTNKCIVSSASSGAKLTRRPSVALRRCLAVAAAAAAPAASSCAARLPRRIYVVRLR